MKSPQGAGIRPTSDLVREAIFSMLESVAIDWSRVLDLYAGTGALGIEALSRGAEWVDFVEKNPRMYNLIMENLDRTGFKNQAKVYRVSAQKALSFLEGAYGIILMDPPYNDPSIARVAEALASSKLVGKESTIVIEHSRRTPLKERFGSFHQVRELHHGDTLVSVYQYTEGES
ncbi:MAG TPA: 16S rRNA (guanine(966)-N(2))-methyltransferase RsmD [Dehalococcoidia bacterium]|nr:16S rRNA (guanine(966)-N(2))-methyltransferase RsmD [Dehalococcoidia bacterium]